MSDNNGAEDLADPAVVARARRLANASVALTILVCFLPGAVSNVLGFQAPWWRPRIVDVSWPFFLAMALAAIATGHLAIARAGGTARWLFGAMVGSTATALVILSFLGWHVYYNLLFLEIHVFPPLFMALAAFVFVRLPAARFRRVPQTGGTTWRPVCKALLGYTAVTLIPLVALSAYGKGHASWENATCGNNLKWLMLVLREHVKEVKGGYFPPLCSRPGVLMFSPETIAGTTTRLNLDIRPFLACPATRYGAAQKTGPDSPFGNQSYFYLGYAVLNDDDVEAFAKAYRERLAEGQPFDDDLVVEISGKTRVLHRLREGLEGVLMAEGAAPADGPAASTNVQCSVPLLVERNLGGHVKYLGDPPAPTPVGHVLYLSGDVQRVPSGTWPMTEKTQRILAELAKLPPLE